MTNKETFSLIGPEQNIGLFSKPESVSTIFSSLIENSKKSIKKRTNKELGDIYENFVEKILSKIYDQVWNYKNIPDTIKKNLGLSLTKADKGYDLLAEKNGIYIFIQCKNYNNSDINQSKLTGFLHFIVSIKNKTGILFDVCHHSKKISKNVEQTGSINFFNIPFNNEEDEKTVNLRIEKEIENNKERMLNRLNNPLVMTITKPVEKRYDLRSKTDQKTNDGNTLTKNIDQPTIKETSESINNNMDNKHLPQNNLTSDNLISPKVSGTSAFVPIKIKLEKKNLSAKDNEKNLNNFIEENIELKEIIKNLQKEVLKLKEELDKLKNENKLKNDEKIKLETENKELSLKNLNLHQALDKSHEANNFLFEQNINLKKNSSKEELEKLQKENQILKQSLSELEKKFLMTNHHDSKLIETLQESQRANQLLRQKNKENEQNMIEIIKSFESCQVMNKYYEDRLKQQVNPSVINTYPKV